MGKQEESDVSVDVDAGEVHPVSAAKPNLQRRLGGKEVQLFAIGGAIGTSALM